jgi:hypothetical protein
VPARAAQPTLAKNFANHIEWLMDSADMSFCRKTTTLRRAMPGAKHSLI